MLLPSRFAASIVVMVVCRVAGAMNAIAGGGTLLTFPALVGLGISPIVANATSTVALWPGAVSSMWGYREELARRPPMGDRLRGAEPARRRDRRVAAAADAAVALRRDRPWLVLGATALFMLQPIDDARDCSAARARRRDASRHRSDDASDRDRSRQPACSRCSSSSAIYGGYFGAGVGILMLAMLGFMGLTNIHRMNGLKNWGGMCMNFVAASCSRSAAWCAGRSRSHGRRVDKRRLHRFTQGAARSAEADHGGSDLIGLTGGLIRLFDQKLLGSSSIPDCLAMISPGYTRRSGVSWLLFAQICCSSRSLRVPCQRGCVSCSLTHASVPPCTQGTV